MGVSYDFFYFIFTNNNQKNIKPFFILENTHFKSEKRVKTRLYGVLLTNEQVCKCKEGSSNSLFCCDFVHCYLLKA